MGVVYQGTLRGKNRKWIFQLIKAGGTLISDDHDVGLSSNLQWGEDSPTGFLDRLIMPASLAVEFTDPGSAIWEDFRTSGANAFTLRLYDSTLTYSIDLYVRLADAFTALKPDIEVPRTRLLATCGLTRLPQIDAPGTDNDTTHLVFRRILVDTLRGQDIQYLFGTRNERVNASGIYITSTRYQDLTFQYTGLGDDPDEKDTAGNQLTDFAEAYQCMVWNDFFYGRRWMVAQPWLLGRDVSEASRLSQLYDHSLSTVDDADYPGQVAALVAEDKSFKAIYDADKTVRISIASKRDQYGDTDIQMGSLNQGWNGSDNVFWEESDVGIFHETTEGGYIDDGGESIYQRTLLIAGGKWVRITVQFEFALEYTPAGSGNHQVGSKLIARPLDPAGTVEYAEDAGTMNGWTTTDTTILEGSQTPDANGTLPSSLTWHSAIHTVADYMPEDGYIELQLLGDPGTDYFLHLRNITIELEDQAASAVTDTPPWPAQGTSGAVGGSVTEGDVIEYQRPWHPVTWVIDSVDTVDVQIDVDGFGTFGLPAKWEDASEVSGPYWDLNEWTIRARLARGEGGRLIRGEHIGIITPGTVITYLGVRYIVCYCSVNLHEEVSEFIAYEEKLSLAA